MELIDARSFQDEYIIEHCDKKDYICMFSERILYLLPDIKKKYNLHIEVVNTDTLLNHIPIEGLTIHYAGNVEELLRDLSTKWLKKIKYLRICDEDDLRCIIYNDKITIDHKSYDKIDIYNVMNNHYRYLTRQYIPKHVNIYIQPKEIQLLDEQLMRECSPILSNTLVYFPPNDCIPITIKSVVKKHRVMTPAWLAYYILNKADVKKIQTDNTIRYRLSTCNELETYTLRDVMYDFIVFCKPYIVPKDHKFIYDDIVLRSLIWIETYYLADMFGL